MRLITLLIALAIISGLVIYNKNSLFLKPENSHQTVKQQSQQILDSAKAATQKMQKQLDEQQKRLDQFNK